MEKLTNHTLVYDSDCPMCDLYTKGFIKAGMLDDNGRVAYGCARVPVTFDNQRARNEIALIDYNEGTVTYGLDSLIKVVGHSFPALSRLLKFRPLHFILDLLYSFISYNRKVIAPPKVFEKRGACTPEFKVGYRIAYVVFAWVVTSLILGSFVPLAIQIILQMVFVRIINPGRMLHYIGNMMTVSLIGSLLMLPMIILNKVTSVPQVMMLTWLAVVVTFVMFLHLRRVELLGMKGLIHVSWIASMILIYWININPDV